MRIAGSLASLDTAVTLSHLRCEIEEQRKSQDDSPIRQGGRVAESFATLSIWPAPRSCFPKQEDRGAAKERVTPRSGCDEVESETREVIPYSVLSK